MIYAQADSLITRAFEGNRICFSIPGELNDGFLSQIAMFNLVLRKCVSPYCDARIIAYLAADNDRSIPKRWRKYLTDVEVRFVDRDEKHKLGYFAQAMERFKENDPELDYVILCDADTLILGSLDEVVSQLLCGFPVAGVIAHYHPHPIIETNDDWIRVSTELTGKPVSLKYLYTLRDPNIDSAESKPRAPFYVNHGFLPFRADALREFCVPYLSMRQRLEDVIDTPFFVGQISLALTVNTLDWDCAVLPMRFNFPNDDKAENLHAYEAQDVRVLHYLRERNFKRNTIFSTNDYYLQFMQKQPEDSDHILYDVLIKYTGGEYPFGQEK